MYASTIRSNSFRTLIFALAVAAALAYSVGCYDDNMGDMIALENAKYQELPVAVPDGFPVPGDGGVITTMDIKLASVRLSWRRASDDITPQGDLEYRVYYAKTPIPTSAAAEAYGTPFGAWTADLTGMDVTGLSGSTVYYFNVLVRDGDLHISNYIMVSATTSTPGAAVYLFSAGSRQGNLSTVYSASIRKDVDSICRSSATYAKLGTGNVRAFISVDNVDSIKNMPANYGIPLTWAIKSAGGAGIASSWSSLFQSSGLPDTLEHLGVVLTFWWSGSVKDGVFDSGNSCNGWTDNTNSYDGTVGAHNNSAFPQWVGSAQRHCNNSHEVLCVAW